MNFSEDVMKKLVKTTVVFAAALILVFSNVQAEHETCTINAHNSSNEQINQMFDLLDSYEGIQNYTFDRQNNTLSIEYDDALASPHMLAYDINKATGLLTTIEEDVENRDNTIKIANEEIRLQKRMENFINDIIHESLIMELQIDLKSTF